MDHQANGEETRRRKTHRKSRKGCGNCKLRRVKCDETQPQCTRCINYGVTCNYALPVPLEGTTQASNELHLPGESAFTFLTQPQENYPLPVDRPKDSLSPEGRKYKLDGLVGQRRKLHDTDEEYVITLDDVDWLHYFREKTVYTIGTAQTVHTYRNVVTDMACYSHTSYLFHITLTLSIMHHRHETASNPWATQPSSKESFHYFHGTGLFSKTLWTSPLREEDRDPLWACAAFLGCLTIASCTASCAEEAWPLKEPSINDLDWLRMSDGKKEVWRLVDPLREASVFREALDYGAHKDPQPYSHPVPELNLLYPWLTKIYDFDPDSTANNQDPYHTAVSILTRLLQIDCNHHTIMYFLSFVGHMTPKFRNLLHQKDPKALLLLAWWFGKMCQYNVWWQSRRMVLEGQAICLYLEKTCEDEEVRNLLVYPKMMTGLISREG